MKKKSKGIVFKIEFKGRAGVWLYLTQVKTLDPESEEAGRLQANQVMEKFKQERPHNEYRIIESPLNGAYNPKDPNF